GPFNDALHVAALRFRAYKAERRWNTPVVKPAHYFRKPVAPPPPFRKRRPRIDVKDNLPATVARKYRGNEISILIQNPRSRNLGQRPAWRQNKSLFRESAHDVRILGQQHGVGQQLSAPPHRQFKTDPAG